MTTPSHYWTCIGINGLGHCQTLVLEPAQAFFNEQVSPTTVEAGDRAIQQHLVTLLQQDPTSTAQTCLRCFISYCIHQTCLAKVKQFGPQHNFTLADLAPLVLDPLPRPHTPAPKAPASLTAKILATFDPAKSNLSTWTRYCLKSHREYKRFLLQHGLEDISNWSLLCNRAPSGLQRILTQHFHQTPQEVKAAVQLLETFHRIYRTPIRQQKRRGRQPYPQPHQDQLIEIGKVIDQPPEAVLSQLQQIAQHLREYRTQTYGKSSATPAIVKKSEPTPDPLLEQLQPYIDDHLKTAIQAALDARIAALERQHPEKIAPYRKGLELLHCHSLPMGEIAQQIDLKAQYQVSRLLNLKAFRTQVRRHLLKLLKTELTDLAIHYQDPDRLSNLDQQLDSFLNPYLDDLLQAPAREANTSRNRTMTSQFARTLCHVLTGGPTHE